MTDINNSKDVEFEINGHAISLIVFECDNGHGAVGFDLSFLDQVDNEVKCPYCNVTHKVL